MIDYYGVLCDRCHGRGTVTGRMPYDACPKCEGAGIVAVCARSHVTSNRLLRAAVIALAVVGIILLLIVVKRG